MRFVHSCGHLGLFLSRYTLDHCGDLRGIIEPGEFVLPGAIFLHMLLDVLHQITEAFPLVIARALIMDIAERPLNRIGAWTIGRQPQQHTSGVARQPLLNGFGFMDTVIIDHYREPGHPGGGVGVIEQRQEVTKKRIGFPGAEAMGQSPSREVERSGQRVLCVLARCPDFSPGALWASTPPRPWAREWIASVIGTDQHRMGLQLCGMPPHPGQAFHPAADRHLWPPAWPVSTPSRSRGASGARFLPETAMPLFGLERPRERGTAPPRAAPAIGTGGFVPQGAQGARQPGQQDGRLDSHGERTVGLHP